jgi:hypothetical protein
MKNEEISEISFVYFSNSNFFLAAFLENMHVKKTRPVYQLTATHLKDCVSKKDKFKIYCLNEKQVQTEPKEFQMTRSGYDNSIVLV